MKAYLSGPRPVFFLFLLLFSCCLLHGCNTPPTPKKTIPEPPRIQQLTAPAQLTAAELTAGVSVTFLDKFYRSIEQMPTPAEAKAKGRKGDPLYSFDYKYAKDALVFGSGYKTGVGIVMEGYLHFPAPGEYKFQALANDGIEFVVDGKLLFEDPEVHKDKLSPIGIAVVPAGGWYPLTIRYFQRKGTATLKLYWQPPGATDFIIIPKEAYAHKK